MKEHTLILIMELLKIEEQKTGILLSIEVRKWVQGLMI